MCYTRHNKPGSSIPYCTKERQFWRKKSISINKKMKIIAIPWFEFVNRMKVEEEIWGKRIRFMDFLTKVINNAGIKEFLCGVGSRLAVASHEFADQ